MRTPQTALIIEVISNYTTETNVISIFLNGLIITWHIKGHKKNP